MINWFDMPAEGLSNGGLFEVKELEVTENGTYETKGEMYNKVTVNVEGGGGSSDFSTAEVTLVIGSLASTPTLIEGACINEDDGVEYIDIRYPVEENTTSVIPAVLYKGEGSVIIDTTATVNVEGNIQQMSPGAYLITGDCTITIS